MTDRGRRPSVIARRQDALLARLAVARDYRPGRPASVDPDAVPVLAIVAAAEHLLELCRLARMSAPVDEDAALRRVVVVVGAVASAIAADVRSGTADATTELYLAIVNFQNRRNA
jgi:hypothetical protein